MPLPKPRSRCQSLAALLALALSTCTAEGVLLGFSILATACAYAAPADLSASARESVAQALYAASATSAAAERVADARIAEQRRQIEALQAKLKAAPGGDAAMQARVRELQAQLAQAQERFVQQLAERDRAYAREIAVFRSAVQDIASTPEGEAALRQFNAGDEVGALAVLDKLVDARERARKARADIETAAERRRVATLALDARAKGKLDTQAVIARFEEVTRLDPGLHWDWVELARLYRDAGKLPQARQAAERAAQTAADDRDRSVALDELANVLLEQGDLTGARTRYQESLDIRKRLAAADPSSASLQRDLLVSYVKLSEVTHDKSQLRMALDLALRMREQGFLAPRDAGMIEELKRRLGP